MKMLLTTLHLVDPDMANTFRNLCTWFANHSLASASENSLNLTAFVFYRKQLETDN